MTKYPNSGALTVGLILIALGVIFLVENFYAPFTPWDLIARYWPVCLIIIGLSRIFAYFVRTKESADESVDTPSKEQPIAGKRPPSLISTLLWTGLGVLFLLSNFGIIPDVWTLTKRYWPVLLIFLGAGKVVDYFFRKSSMSIRIGEFFGLVGILIFGIFFTFILGILVTKKSDFRLGLILSELPLRIGNVQVRPEQWLGNSHAYMEEATYPLEGAKRIRIENSHGAVSVSPGSDRQIRVRLNKVVYADEARARDLADRIRVEGRDEPPGPGSGLPGTMDAVFVITTNRNSIDAGNHRIETDMEIFVPKNSQLQVRNSFGDVRVVGIDGNLDLGTTHRNLEVRDCKGQFIVSSRYGECRLVDLTGNLTLNGRSEAYLENIKGDIKVTNEFSPTVISRVDGKVTVDVAEGDLRIENVSQSVAVDARGAEVYVARLQDSLKITASHRSVRIEDISSDVSLDSRYADIYLKEIRGNVEIQSDSDSIHADAVDGNLTMNGRGSGVRVNDAGGKLNIRTTLKDVIVGELTGACSIENEFADISLSLSDRVQKDVNIKNRNGRIDLFLPEADDFSLNAVARQGRVESFYAGLEPAVTAGNTGTLDYNINSAGAKIRLVTEYDNIRIFGGERNENSR
ncbi:MAG: DUF4097 family beta strand repeat protein [Acidobacteria bacterium]|nr:DUF4097 family beta strand repeat protein [Acidobacteriota bacterium]